MEAEAIGVEAEAEAIAKSTASTSLNETIYSKLCFSKLLFEIKHENCI